MWRLAVHARLHQQAAAVHISKPECHTKPAEVQKRGGGEDIFSSTAACPWEQSRSRDTQLQGRDELKENEERMTITNANAAHTQPRG